MSSGIYKIRCIRNGQCYVGSSKCIPRRWVEHRRLLRRGVSVCVYLQNAWTKYGEATFEFSVLEECAIADLETREQFYVDLLEPAFNALTDVKRRHGAEMLAKRAATLKARAALITHCPKGHAYDEANTYLSKKGKRICRACNAERVSGVYASETPEEREARRERAKASHLGNRDKNLVRMREYASTRKEQKRAYDQSRKELKRKADRLRRCSPTYKAQQREYVRLRRMRMKQAGSHADLA